MAGKIDRRLKELGIELPTAREPSVAKILNWTIANGFLFVSGQVPQWNGERRFVGKVGREYDLAQGQAAARLSALNVLAHARAALGGDLDRVERVLVVRGFVNADPEFEEIPQVVNGASELFIDVFGDAGRHTRTAVGVAIMPFDVAIEVEAQFLVRD
jgi:enamine deaminase RidA (YjgF/YER057c/UK114 family)